MAPDCQRGSDMSDVRPSRNKRENKKGRRVKLIELHTQGHTKKGTKPGEAGSSGILEFVDPMSKKRLDEYLRIISEKHVENEENAETDKNGSKSPPDDFDFWKGVATLNRGLVLGAGSTKDHAFVLTGILDPREMRILKQQNDDLKKKMEDERVDAEA
ncbi:transposase, Ptta/En/Spm [Tanacetum coccineum]